jgi:hypothetical protein
VAAPRVKLGPALEKLDGVRFRRLGLTAERWRLRMKRPARFATRAEKAEFATISYYPLYRRRVATSALQRQG